MKKIFLICATAAFLSACNNDSKTGIETTKEVAPDSAQYKNSVNTDTAKTATVPLAAPLPSKTEVRKETKTSTATKTKTTTPGTTTQAPVSTTTETTPATTNYNRDNHQIHNNTCTCCYSPKKRE